MKLKMKRLLAVLMAFCVMASAVMPVMADKSSSAVLESAENEDQQGSDLQDEEQVQENLPDLSVSEPMQEEQPTETLEQSEENQPAETAQKAEENEPVAALSMQDELAAPSIPGYTLYTADTLDTNKQYLIVAQDQKGENKGQDVYALYLSQIGLSIASGKLLLSNNGALTAKLDLSASPMQASYLNNGTALSQEDLLIRVSGNQSEGYSFKNEKSGYYLALDDKILSTNQVNLSVEKAQNGSWLIRSKRRILGFNVNGDGSLTQNKFVNNATDFWGPVEQQTYSIYLYTKDDEVVAQSSVPQGTTQGQPFIQSETAGGDYFRIPSLTTLSNGWILAAADIRWKVTTDSPHNLDTIVSVSKDNGETWEYQVVNYFDDMANDKTSLESASFIDPSIVEGQDGTIYMVADACPSYVGLMNGNRMGKNSSGFDDEGRLLIAKAGADADAPIAVNKYTYRVDLNAQPSTVFANGKQVELYPIVTQDGQQTGTWVDAELDEYTWDGQNPTALPVLCKQNGSDDMVHNNLFYRQSEWKVYPVFYIVARTAKVENDQLVWGQPKFLDIKLSEKEAFTGVCPGRGITTVVDGKERIVFPVYDNQTGTELASTIYSDDGGVTWQRGQRASQLNKTGKSSESQIIRLPNGALRMYSRNTSDWIGYTDSYDGGVTWGQYQLDKNLSYTSNCMVSFINLDGYVVDSDGTVYTNLVMTSYPKYKSRTNGVVRVGSIDENTNEVTWLNEANVLYANAFEYSCLTQKNGNEIGMLYETHDQSWAPGKGRMFYTDLTITGVLGDGWYYLQQLPETMPAIEITADSNELMVGDSTTLSANTSEGTISSEVSWSIQSDDGQSVAALASDAGNTIQLTATKAGKATVTATTTVLLDDQTLPLKTSKRVYISDQNTIILPDEYEENEMVETVTRTQVFGEVDTGIYTIYAQNGQRILYHANGSSKTDQMVIYSLDDEKLTLDLSIFPESRQKWKIEKTQQGYTIESYDEPGKYLNISGATTNHLPVSNKKTYFQITPAGNGTQYVSTTVGGKVYYLYFDNKANKFGATTTKTATMMFFKEDKSYAVDVSGLLKMIADINDLNTSETIVYKDSQQAEEQKEQVQRITEELYNLIHNLK